MQVRFGGNCQSAKTSLIFGDSIKSLFEGNYRKYYKYG